ncbi:Plant transposase (Ptta/En/Spm family) [Abeliophyllum distichum]|uniref:Plant transposase (Ptta/En/Spm family) n=1 Tax=Abeliophyllum distichum TaxID=126358 RepID=A0ABD1RG00_9LAMI
MSMNYDNWERPVGADLRPEQDREVACSNSRSTSFSSNSISLDFDELSLNECNKYVLKQLNAAWKDEKTDLKREYFIPFATREDRIANRLDKVPEDQWTVLVEYWENPKTLEKVGKNVINRKRHKIMHTGGSKSFIKHAVEIEEDPELDAPLGTPTTQLKIFRKTHTRKDKTPINELDKEKMDQMKELANKATEDGSSMYSTEHDDIFTQVMGSDSRGQKRCFGRAIFPRELSNATSNRDNAEARSLKEKVVDVQEELKSTKKN